MIIIDVKKRIVQSLFFNTCILVLLLMFFEPTIKTDDYDMAMVLYGGITGKYSGIAMYISVFFSNLIKVLITFMPNIPWYAGVQFIFIFLSFVILFIVLGDRYTANNRIVYILFFILCGYELYIRMTFTKTSGFLVLTGLLYLLKTIECGKNNLKKWCFSIVWILLGSSIRFPMLTLLLEIYFAVFLISILLHEKKTTPVCLIISTVMLIVGQVAMVNSNSAIISQSKEWSVYNENNNARAVLQDYTMPDYEEYAEEYENLGISHNDYTMFKEWSLYNDYDVYSTETLRKIAQIDNNDEANNIYIIFKRMLKELLANFFGEPAFYFFVFFIIWFFSSKGIGLRKKNSIVIPTLLTCFIAYSYMYYRGRIQHHVNVIVFIAGITILFYYYNKYSMFLEKKRIVESSVVLIVLITVFYNSIYNSSYYELNVRNQKDLYNNNKRIIDMLSEDKEHVYVFCAYTNQKLYDACFLPYEIIPKEYYSNLDITNRYYIPDWMSISESYGVDNYYEEATDSDTILFVCLDENNGWIDGVQCFINEHYNKNSRYEHVKTIHNLEIYRFVED